MMSEERTVPGARTEKAQGHFEKGASRPLRRYALRFSAILLASSLVVGSHAVLRAQSPPPAKPTQGSVVENEALELFRKNKLLTARKKAEEAIEADPDS